MSRRLLALLFAAALVALAAMIFAIRGARNDSSSAQVPQAPASPFEGAVLPDGVRAPDFSLRDQDGRRVTMREYRGRTTIVTFLYSHCHDTCPVEAQQIRGALDDLGRNLPVLAISVDPPNDTPGAIARFNAEQGVTGRIRWATGSRRELAKVWKAFGVTGQTSQVEHIAHILLVDRHGIERVGFPAQQTTPERLAHDLRVLDAQAGRA